MKKIYSLTLALILLMCVSLKAQLPSNVEVRFQAVLDSVCNTYKIKGVSTAVFYPGSGLWKGTTGVSHKDVAVKSDMLFGMGSNTKTLVSVAVLKMQEKGLLNLDDSIGKWIRNQPGINGKITIRQCLNHTSGVYDYTKNRAWYDSLLVNPGKQWTKNEIFKLVKTPDFAAGAYWNYSNTNYIIIGSIIEQVSGKPHQQLIKELVLDPAKLNETYFYDQLTSFNSMSHQWSMLFSSKMLTDMNRTEQNYLPNIFSMASTAGGMVTTAEDNVMFWHKLMSGQLLNEESMKQFKALVDLGDGDGYGLGVYYYNKAMNSRSFYTHGGSIFGFSNENLFDPVSGVCIAILTNQDSISNNTLLSTVIKALHKTTIQNPLKTGLSSNMKTSLTLSYYPNPASDLLRLNIHNYSKPLQLILCDLNGKKVLNEEITGVQSEIPVRDLDNGLYISLLVDENGEILHTSKIIISK